jgi:hypothetical protein
MASIIEEKATRPDETMHIPNPAIQTTAAIRNRVIRL